MSLSQDSDQWLALVNTVMKPSGSKGGGGGFFDQVSDLASQEGHCFMKLIKDRICFNQSFTAE
jgi:hypothetical protein